MLKHGSREVAEPGIFAQDTVGQTARHLRRSPRHATNGYHPANLGSGERCGAARDRKSTRLNSSHSQISYAVFCLKKKTTSISRPPKSAIYSVTTVLPAFADYVMKSRTYRLYACLRLFALAFTLPTRTIDSPTVSV